jgi:hypothetical protein
MSQSAQGFNVNTGASYSMPNIQPIQPLSVADIGHFTLGGSNKLPNKKLTLSIHQATGGYVVTIDKGQYGEEPDMYVIDSDKDIGTEIGKIITHHTLSK